MKTVILLLAMVTATVGCSTRYKSTDPQVSSEEMQKWLNEAAQQVSGQNLSANDLLNDPATLIYFADTAIGTMGNVISLLAFYNLNFFDPSVWIDSVGEARVFFLDNPGDGTKHTNMLIVGIQTDSGAYTYKAFDGNGIIEGGNQWDTGEFSMGFAGADGLSYVLRSFDVQEGQLSNDIQLKMYQLDESNNEVYVGKFSILAGYQ